MMTWPKPAQKPYPPIIVGGAFPMRLDVPSATATGGCRLLVGRPMATSTITYRSSSRWSLKLVASPEALPITLFGGTEDANLLKRYRDMGVARVVHLAAGADREDLTRARPLGRIDPPRQCVRLTKRCSQPRSFARSPAAEAALGGDQTFRHHRARRGTASELARKTTGWPGPPQVTAN